VAIEKSKIFLKKFFSLGLRQPATALGSLGLRQPAAALGSQPAASNHLQASRLAWKSGSRLPQSKSEILIF
jgi:hypothetical protein